MPSTQGSPLWNDGLKLVSFCPVCESRYTPTQARMLGTQGQTHLLHVNCKKCQNSIIALVLVNQVGASSVGLLTDLSYDDVLRFREDREIHIDDVMATHAWMEDMAWEEALGRVYREQISKVMRKRLKNIESKNVAR